MGPHALRQGCQVSHYHTHAEDKEEEPGRVTVLELLGKIDERVRIYEQVGKSQEKIKVVLICYLDEGQC